MMGLRTLLRQTTRPFRWFRHASRKKKIFTVLLLIVLLGIAGNTLGKNKAQGYTFAEATHADVADIVSESGSVVAGGNSTVYSPTTGIVKEVYVQNGNSVEKGQELFKVESNASEQETQAAYANYLAAKSQLDTAVANENVLRADMYDAWEAYTDLANNGTYEKGEDVPNEENRKLPEFQIAQDTWKAAEAKYKNQQTAISQARASVNSTSLLYQATQDAVVKAPMSGVVANLSVTERNSVSAKLPSNTVMPVLTLASLASTEVAVALNEVDVVKVAPGQEVVIEVNAVEDKTYRGVTKRVDSIGTDNLGVVTYNAYIEFLNPDNLIRSGMTADVDIRTEVKRNVLSVPNAAVKPYKGGRAVRVIDPKTKKMIYKPVVIGVKGVERTEIVSGINEGDEVITALSNDQIKRPGLF